MEDVLRRKHDEGEIPPLLTVESHAQVRDAVALLHEHRVSQLPVVSSHDPADGGRLGEQSAGCCATPWTIRPCSAPRSPR